MPSEDKNIRWDLIVCAVIVAFGFLLMKPFEFLPLFAIQQTEVKYHQYQIKCFQLMGNRGRSASIIIRTNLANKKYFLVVDADDVVGFLLPWIGVKKVSVGDESFDKNFIVRANDEDRTRAVLSPSIRGELKKRVRQYPEIQIKSGVLTYRKDLYYAFNEELVSEGEFFNHLLDAFTAAEKNSDRH